MMKNWLGGVVLSTSLAALFLFTTGCNKSAQKEEAGPKIHTVQSFQLASVESCQDVKTYLEDMAVKEMKRAVDQTYWWNNYHWGDDSGYGGPFGCGASSTVASDQGMPEVHADSGGSGAEASSTNVQEAGVDEPDFIKNNSQTLFVLSGEYLVIVDGVPAAQAHEISRIKIEGIPIAMVRDQNLVAVVSGTDLPESLARPGSGTPVPHPGPVGGVGMSPAVEPYGNTVISEATKVTVLSVETLAAPQVVREIYLEGQYVTGRKMEGRFHVVTSSRTPGPEMELSADTAMGRENLKTANELEIRAQSFTDLVPRFAVRQGSVEETGPMVTCDSLYTSQNSQGRNLLNVTTLGLNEDNSVKTVSIASPPGIVYASKQSLVVATYLPDYWVNWEDGGYPEAVSVLHKFSLGKDSPVYQATGKVKGAVHNQFSLDEEAGVLRVATTTNGWWNNLDNEEPANHFFTLGEEEGLLTGLGSITGIAPNERITSARIEKDRAYLVTFRQIDPLFTIDLKDDAHPKVMGELEVTGFSEYIHPMSDGKLLTIGVDGNNWGQWGLALSLFDVQDMENPSLLHRTVQPGAWSEAQNEHKAFNYFPPKGVLAIPVSGDHYDSGSWSYFTGLEVWDVSLGTGFTSRGLVNHHSFVEETSNGYYDYASVVHRSVIIGDVIFSISGAGIKANSLNDLNVEYASIALPQ